ncbi:hypothetical protein L873DRAFT_1812501 [Choiromyces venosus 120613-1]|uniref:Uncharacterized protein n=1 Tax=Choiromyces venosus 120613-1 TaxID=1336337 RepID=A0A3N4JH37_9PEZI|nr:hypothetical protein L873DRAFT_1812501 [Choiromyces venosus 120613-1]
MLKSKLITPFQRRTDNSNQPTFGENELNLPRPPYVKRRSSTPSNDSLGKKIQRHLDAGNPLYIGFDPADPLRDSTLVPGQGRGGDIEGCVGEEAHTTASRKKNWRRKAMKALSCGVPLDVCARIILTIGMILALLSLLWSVNWIIQRKDMMDPENLTFISYLTISQCVWGLFFGAACLFGFILMWGKWRRSPTTALFFTITWILVTILLLVTSVLWLYFYFYFRSRHFMKCRAETINAGPTFDRQATQDQIDNCLQETGKNDGGVLLWGIIYTVMLYAGIIIVVWGRDYRRRLLEIQECEELAGGPGAEGEKVGLLLGTAPLGRLAHNRRMTIGPKKSELAESAAVEEERRPKNTIVRFSGTIRMGEAVPASSSSSSAAHERNRDRKGSDSSVESLGLGISVGGQSFVGSSSQGGRSMAY